MDSTSTWIVARYLDLRPGLDRFQVYYGGYSGRDDEISMMTRSRLQVMLEFAAGVKVPESDVAAGKAFAGTVEGQAVGSQAVGRFGSERKQGTVPCGDGNLVRRLVVLDLGNGHPIKEHLCNRHVLVLDFRLRSERPGTIVNGPAQG